LVELMHKQCYMLPERPAMLVTDLPPELDEFICILLDKNPGRRPASAASLLEELERIRGKLERKGERLEWPVKLTPDTAEMAALPAALGGMGGESEAEGEPRPLLKRPVVVIPLFLIVMSALVLPFVWPSKSADELYAEAKPLVESDNPANWDIALEQFIDPLSRKYPDRYVEEIAAIRAKVKDRRELKRIIAEGAKVDFKSDAESAYFRGLRLAQAGETESAKRIWRDVEAAFGTVPSESRWVELARVGLTALDKPENRNLHGPPDRGALDTALKNAKSFAAAGKTSEANAIYRALQELFRDDPVASDAIRRTIENK